MQGFYRLFFVFISLLFVSATYAQDVTGTTVMTFNLANYNDHGDWDKRINLIVDAIENAKADIVVLQEVRFDPDQASSTISYQNMAEQILTKLHERQDFQEASIVTQPIMYYPIAKNTLGNTHPYPLPAVLSPEHKSYVWEGLTIISKRKIIETGSFFLSKSVQCKDFNARATQYVKIDNHQQPLIIANVHFALDTVCSMDNMRETIAYLTPFNTYPTLIMGDFNATPENIIFKPLITAGFVDIWHKLFPQQNGYTYPANAPIKRIDYIWANQQLAEKIINGDQMMLVGENKQEGLLPSDHFGLAVKF